MKYATKISQFFSNQNALFIIPLYQRRYAWDKENCRRLFDDIVKINILKESAEVSAEQAKRDAVLAFKTEIQGEFEKILKTNIGKALSGDGLGKLIRAAVAGENVADCVAEVAEVSDALKSELAKEIKDGLEIRPTKGVQTGFRLASKDGSGYFDCSDDGIMEMLMPYFRDLDFQ